LTLVLLALSLWPAAARSGPIYDPWLERFQVGAATPAAGLDDGYPSGLLETARPDTAWTRAALRLLDTERPAPPDAALTHRWLGARSGPAAEAMSAARAAVLAFADTSATLADLRAVDGVGLLEAEIGARRVFAALKAGDLPAARAEAEALSRRDAPGVEPREAFLWGLRARRLARLGGGEPAESAVIWPEALPLPPFDAGNAWALWVAHSRTRGQAPLAPPTANEAWRSWLASVGRAGGLQPPDLGSSGLPEPWRAAVGAALLPKADLDAHFRRYPTPPDDVDLQGMWVNGRRTARQGEAAAYEEIAATPGLRPVWRLDLWRRAAELRLLAGDEARARADLDKALALARDGSGTNSTRRRLRQWVEQAMVRAIARNEMTTARSLRDAGRATFTGPELQAFLTETRHWEARLGETAAAPDTLDLPGRAAWLVESGKSPDVHPAGAGARASFTAAADRPLWELWARWGRAFADSGSAQGREAAYGRRLADVRDTADPAANGVLPAVAPLLAEPRLLGQVLDTDIARLTGGATAPRPSLVPALVQAAGADHLLVHALLGFALAVGDQRGILAAATVLPQRGLTADERRLFLYPLPAPGPVRDALLAADNDPALVLAVARNESLFEAAARSRAGALGWMQIMPFHYERRGAQPGAEHWSNAPVSIAKGDRLLSDGARRYAGDPYRMLAGYNAGYEATDRWDRQLGGGAARDVYLAWIGYPETRHYVEKVLIDRAVYQSVIGGPAPARD
jgi:soluble lytic murein transglycosylase-like protein